MLGIKEIEEIIPHRHPFLLVDRIEELELGERAVGYKAVSFDEYFFRGHFPQEPVMPGVLIIEALAQVGAAAILSLEENKGKTAYFGGIHAAKFKRKVVPGFGFLSENTKFVEMCEKFKITFIGPNSEMIHRMGNKSEARKTMEEAGIPIIPGTKELVYDAEEAKQIADELGYPLMIKASAGGGGKGMRVAENSEEFTENFCTAQREAGVFRVSEVQTLFPYGGV